MVAPTEQAAWGWPRGEKRRATDDECTRQASSSFSLINGFLKCLLASSAYSGDGGDVNVKDERKKVCGLDLGSWLNSSHILDVVLHFD